MQEKMQGRVLNGLRVLVAEDQYLIAEDMRRVVLSLGGEVIGPVGQVSAAADLLDGQKPDLALLDINLHGEMVYDFAEQLRDREVPVIFATGYGSPDVRSDFAHAVRLEKPVTAEALAAAVRSLGVAP